MRSPTLRGAKKAEKVECIVKRTLGREGASSEFC